MKNRKQIAERKAEQYRRDNLSLVEKKAEDAIKLEEKKSQDEEHTRLRARRKAMFEVAKLTDKMVQIACDTYDKAAKKSVEHKKVLASFQQEVDRLEVKAKKLDDEIKRLQIQWRATRDTYGKKKTMLQQLYDNKAARGIHNIEAAFTASEIAWNKLNKAQIKKYRDRRIKKRAKDILK